MNKVVFIFLLVVFFGCKKETADPVPMKPACELNDWGTIRTLNNEKNPYNIFVNNIFVQQIPAYDTGMISEVPSGHCLFKAVQASGFVFYPTVYEASFIVKQCETSLLKFP